MIKDKKYYFISGLPRSGSTLLANILAQNPKFYSTSTSGIMDVIFSVRNNWSRLIEFKASPNDQALIRVMRGMLENYFSDRDEEIIFDKSRSWLSQLELAETILGHKVKVLVPVRDMRDVIASFEKLWRENAPYRQFDQERDFYFVFQTLEGRVKTWLRDDQPVGIAYNRVIDAINRGFADRLLLVDFDDLTSKPKETMKIIYSFLGEEYFDHNFEKVEQKTSENDTVHGIKNLHKIRSKVVPVVSKWKEILGPHFEYLKEMNFWKK